MKTVTGIYRNGQIELTRPVDWPDGTLVQIIPVGIETPAVTSDSTESYRDVIRRLAGSFGDEPFERPPQGEFEKRDEW